MKLFSSLRIRSLVAGTIFFIILLISSYSARQQLLTILDSSQEITTEFDFFKSTLIATREPLQALESRLYLYTILLNDVQKKRTIQYIDEVKYQTNEITTRKLYHKFPKFKDDLNKFKLAFNELELLALQILDFHHDQRYKSISTIINQLTPQHNLFIDALDSATNHLEFYDEGQDSIRLLIDLLQQLHF